MPFEQTRLALSHLPQIPLDVIEQKARHHFPFDNPNPGQMEAIVEAIDAYVNKGKRHVIIEAPTGVGKSLIGITIHLVLNELVMDGNPTGQFRTTISTPTKGLQDQYAKEDCVNMSILKGKKNYRCLVNSEIYYNSIPCRIQCKDGMCSSRRCPYVQARQTWCNMAVLRCTNAAMLVEMCSSLCMEPHNRADFLILDECHKMPHALLDHTIMTYSRASMKGIETLPGGDLIVQAIEFILKYTSQYELGVLYTLDSTLSGLFEATLDQVENLLDVLDGWMEREDLTDVQIMRLSDVVDTLHNLSDYCGIMSNTQAKTFIVHEKEEGMITFKAVLPSDVSEFGMFRKADYYLHMSATICGIPSYAQTLGIKANDFHSIQVANPIPVDNRRINFLPVMKVANKLEDFEYKRLVENIDDIIEHHEGQNGIIHTVSYDRAEKFLQYSRHRQHIVVPRTRKALLEALDNAVRNKRRIIIASPAMVEGYDFKGDLSRFQIILKVPYSFLGDPLVAHVNKIDPSAYFREAILSIVQMAGRSVRGIDDYADTYIVDSSFEMLLARNGDFFPKWFVEALFEI
uniref:DNA helicase n=1 Tax=Serratia phage Kevin TaxID=3161161 RepID=A0AAU8KXI3_9CAUD